MTRLNPEGYSCLAAAQIDNFEPTDFVERREVRRLDRYSQFAIAASKEAMNQAGITKEMVEAGEIDGTRFGVIVSSGIGGIETMENEFDRLKTRGPDRVSPLCIPMFLENMSAGNISMIFGAKGPCSSVVTACASGTNSIGDAFKVIQRGDADLMLAGGSEASITPLAFAGFCAMKAMTSRNDDPQRASRPFDADRDGFVMGEGSGVLLLEELEHAQARGAEILAEVVGYGWSSDAHHVTAPPSDGNGLSRAMTMAINDAGITPQDISYINAHGTSTPINDPVETKSIKTVFGTHAYQLAVSSTKSMIGHALGAAGGIETVITALSIREGFFPATINLDEADPECDLDYVPNHGRTGTIRSALSLSLGFGGHNSVIAVKKV